MAGRAKVAGYAAAFGRKLPFVLAWFQPSESPVSVKAAVQPGRMAAFHPKPVIGLELV
jgi:hypothetical protein